MNLTSRSLHLVSPITGQSEKATCTTNPASTLGDEQQVGLDDRGDRMNAAGAEIAIPERAEVRVLGPLRVRRADGTLVQTNELRTSQTADLLRLLALHVEEPVAVDVLIDALWPTVEEKRGRASLRTAASGIRKALGQDCIRRRLGGLVLTGVWVDAHAFVALAHQVRRYVVMGQLADAVTTTHEAEALYLGEFRSHSDCADWALRERAELAATYRTMIAEAAEAAATLHWWHDAIDLAERTLLVEPCSERGFRALMRGQRGLGETPLALKTYDRCRHDLAAELGADPSAETRELYLELLADTPVTMRPPAFTGRLHELEWLGELAQTTAATREPTLVCLLGAEGAGKTRLVTEAGAAGLAPLTTISCATEPDPWSALVIAIGAELTGPGPDQRVVLVPRQGPVTVLVDDAHLLTPTAVDRLTKGLASLRGPSCVVVAARPTLDDGRAQQLMTSMGNRASILHLPPLAIEEVGELCTDLLHGTASTQLTTHVVASTGGQPGEVIALVRSWAASGRVAATSSGLIVLDSRAVAQPGTPVRHLMRQALDHLSASTLEVLHLIAVLARPVTAELLEPLTTIDRDDDPTSELARLRTALDHLVDQGLLRATESGLALHDPLLRDLALTWLRPSARRGLHRRVAERAAITSAERVDQWMQAGEPQLARAASMHAAADALEEHQYERARLHLRRLCRANEVDDSTPADRAEMFERWGDVALVLGRTHEARAAFAAAASVARAHQLADHDRLEAKSRVGEAGLQPPDAERSAQPEVSAEVSRPAIPRQRLDQVDLVEPEAAHPTIYPGAPTDRHDIAVRMHRAVEDADAVGDPQQRALARAVLVNDVCIPRRKFRAARRWTGQALTLTADPLICAQVLVAAWLPGAVLGDAVAAEEALNRAAALLGSDANRPLTPALTALQALVSHDLGRPDLAARFEAADRSGALADPTFQWVAIRVATERNDLAAAELADRVPTPAGAPAVVHQLRGCASAALAMEIGRPDRARRLLLDVLEIAHETGTTLLVPEAAARLVVLDANENLTSARNRFEQFEAAIGSDTWLPRENVLKLIARAAVRAADGRADDAAAAAASAADVAENAGLVLLAAAAHRHRAVHLTAAGRPSEARLASAAAARWRRYAFGVAPGGPPTHELIDLAGPMSDRVEVQRQDSADEIDLVTALDPAGAVLRSAR